MNRWIVCICSWMCMYGVLANQGSFLHLADFHFDVNYSMYGDVNNYCHLNLSNHVTDIGKFGNQNCDSPWSLVSSAVQAMTEAVPHPDFILWTGDSVPHAPDSMTNTDNVIDTITNITELLNHTFQGVPIYPVLGNHDFWPANQMTGNTNRIYQTLGELWRKWIGDDAADMFKQHGYYSVLIPKNGTSMRLLALNTNFYYDPYDTSENAADPGDQFAYMRQMLNVSMQEKTIVYIMAHIPPGNDFYPKYSQQFVSILREYSSTIKAMFFGHTHTDQFRLISSADDSETYVNVLLVAPAIVPNGNNPGFRSFQYETDTGNLTGLTQHWLNLTKANEVHTATWEIEYTYKDAYNIDSINAISMSNLLREFRSNLTLLQRYHDFYQVKYDLTACSNIQQCSTYLCEIANADHEDYQLCLSPASSSSTSTQKSASTSSSRNAATTATLSPQNSLLGFTALAAVLLVTCHKW